MGLVGGAGVTGGVSLEGILASDTESAWVRQALPLASSLNPITQVIHPLQS